MAISSTDVIAIEWTLVTLALLFVAFRSYVQLIHLSTRFLLSDYLIWLAWFSGVACVVSDTRLCKLGLMVPGRTYTDNVTTFGRTKEDTVALLQLIYGSTLPYYLELWLVKAAILCFYWSIIPITRGRHRIVLFVVSGFVAGSFVLVMCLNAFWCWPIQRNWTLDAKNTCLSFANHTVFFISVACNVITDFAILALPFPLLRGLHVKRRQLWGLVFVFALGALCIIATISRLIALAASATVAQVAVWTAAESSIGIMVACTPALRVLLRVKKRGTGYTHDGENTGPTRSRRTNQMSTSLNQKNATSSSLGTTMKGNATITVQESTLVSGKSGQEWICMEDKNTRIKEEEEEEVKNKHELGKPHHPPPSFTSMTVTPTNTSSDDGMTIEEYIPTRSLDFLSTNDHTRHNDPQLRNVQQGNMPYSTVKKADINGPSNGSRGDVGSRISTHLGATPDSSTEALTLAVPPPVLMTRDMVAQARVQRERWEMGMVNQKLPSPF